MTAHPREELAALVLGLLEPDEQERVAAHLTSCPTCRDEHARLAALPALLDLLPPGAVEVLDRPPPAMEEAVLGGLARERATRSRRRPRPGRPRTRRAAALIGGIIGSAATVGVLGMTGTLGGGETAARSVELSAPASAARATARLDPRPVGTRVTLTVRDLPPTRPGELYEVWFVRGERRVSAGTFVLTGGSDAEVELTTAARAGAYERIGITREPDAADPRKNGPNVLSGRLPA